MEAPERSIGEVDLALLRYVKALRQYAIRWLTMQYAVVDRLMG